MGSHLRLAPELDPDRVGSPGARAIRVVLADEHALMRRSLRLVLDRGDRVEVVAEAPDLAAAVGLVHLHLPGVLVLDLGMPRGPSIDAIGQLRVRVPRTEIVVLTMDDSPGVVQHVLDAGAVGFVLKERADTDLLAAVQGASRGEEYLSPRVVKRLHSMRHADRDEYLTPRETEVLRLIALGHTSAEIAVKLHLPRPTIETYRARLYGRLGLTTRVALVRAALGRGLLRP